MNKYTYLILRLSIGTSMFGHGLVRMPKLEGFSAWMIAQFENSILPKALVVPFSYVLPFAELITGILLLLGLFTRQAIFLGSAVMICLLFGTTIIENWEAIPTQLIHLAFFAVLLQFVDNNHLALDKMVIRK
jgi:thiosulfate dehydrogenase (quinone) large subunit